jgi:hypothetical protein
MIFALKVATTDLRRCLRDTFGVELDESAPLSKLTS